MAKLLEFLFWPGALFWRRGPSSLTALYWHNRCTLGALRQISHLILAAAFNRAVTASTQTDTELLKIASLLCFRMRRGRPFRPQGSVPPVVPELDVLIHCSVDGSTSPMLPPTRKADALTRGAVRPARELTTRRVCGRLDGRGRTLRHGFGSRGSGIRRGPVDVQRVPRVLIVNRRAPVPGLERPRKWAVSGTLSPTRGTHSIDPPCVRLRLRFPVSLGGPALFST